MAGGSLRPHARSHSLVLRASDSFRRDGRCPVPNFKHNKCGTTQRSSLQFSREMGRVLEIAKRATLAKSTPSSDLAATLWHAQLRRSESYNQKWQCVLENPVRGGLVKWACDWPYQGEMTELTW